MKPLTAMERAWVERFAAVMEDMPARLVLLECGDGVFVIDRRRAREVELCDGAASKNGVVLARVQSATLKITGVSG